MKKLLLTTTLLTLCTIAQASETQQRSATTPVFDPYGRLVGHVAREHIEPVAQAMQYPPRQTKVPVYDASGNQLGLILPRNLQLQPQQSNASTPMIPLPHVKLPRTNSWGASIPAHLRIMQQQSKESVNPGTSLNSGGNTNSGQ